MQHSYHLHLSKKHKKEEIFLIDTLAYFSGIIAPFLTIPQLYTIWVQKDAAGVSIISWASYALFSVVFIIYGIAHKNKLIFINNLLWVVMNLLVAIGTFLYT